MKARTALTALLLALCCTARADWIALLVRRGDRR